MSKVPQRTGSTTELPTDRASDTRASKTGAGMTRSTTDKAKKEALKQKMRRVLYTNVLQLPQTTIDSLARSGYTTRWIRIKASEYGREDPGNIAKWRELGYEFVTKEDAPELAFGYTPISHALYGEIITVGDLALAKVLIETRDALQEVKEDETLARSKGILSEAKRPDGITSGRRSFVTRAQKRAEEIHEEVEGDDIDLLRDN